MAIGTTAALIGLAAASAGSQIAGAAMRNRGTNKAVDAQTRATRDANNYNAQMWGQTQNVLSPYVNSGAQSMNLLGSLMMPQSAQGSYRPGGVMDLSRGTIAPPPPPAPPGVPPHLRRAAADVFSPMARLFGQQPAPPSPIGPGVHFRPPMPPGMTIGGAMLPGGPPGPYGPGGPTSHAGPMPPPVPSLRGGYMNAGV